VFDLDSQDAAAVLGVSAATYRKRLSRARERLRAFMRTHCGLISADAACRCHRRIAHAVATGRVRPEALLFAGRGAGRQPRTDLGQPVREMEDLHRMAAIYKGHPEYAAPDRILEEIRRILDAGRLTLLRYGRS